MCVTFPGSEGAPQTIIFEWQSQRNGTISAIMSLNVAHSQEGPVAARTGLKASIGGPGVRKCIRGGSCEMGKNENSCLACCQPASADCSEELLLRDGIPNDTAAAIATNCFDLIYFSFYNPPPAPPTPTTPTPPLPLLLLLSSSQHRQSSIQFPPLSRSPSVSLSLCRHRHIYCVRCGTPSPRLHHASGREHLSLGPSATKC